MGKFLKYPKYALLTIFSVLNILCVVGMIVCAYSAYISPASHPKFSFLGMIFPAFLIATALFIFFWMLFKPKFMLISIIGMLLCARSIRSYCPINFFNRTAPEGSLKVTSTTWNSSTMQRRCLYRSTPAWIICWTSMPTLSAVRKRAT